MAITIYSQQGQIDAMVAAAAAANGSKNSAFLTSWQTTLGTDPKVRLYRNSTLAYDGYITGSIPISGSSFAVTSVTTSSTPGGDIDTGTWELRVEKASDANVYIGSVVTKTGADNTLALSDDLGSLTSINFNLTCDLDIASPAEVQKSSLVTGSNASSIQMTLGSQPTAQNKLFVPITYYEGFRGLNSPTDCGATVWFDFSDFSSLRPNADGTGTITSHDQLVRRVNNKGSAGGWVSSSAGWYLRRATASDGTVTGGYYLEASGSTEVVSNIASSSAISVSAGEVIVAARPTNSSDPGNTDYWYSVGLVQFGDGYAGITFKDSDTAWFYNYDGSPDVVEAAYVQNSDQLFTWQHTGGNLLAKVGFGAPTGSVASGNTSSLSEAFALGGVFHGSFPRMTGRIYGVVMKTSAFSTTEREFLQWYLHRKMLPVTALSSPSITDNANNTYTLIKSTTDALSKLWTGLFVCHTVAAGTGTFTVTATMPGSTGYYVAGQVQEVSDLQGAVSLDVTGSATNDASGTTLVVSTDSTTTYANEYVISVFGVYKADSAVGMTTPSGYTQIGATNDAQNLVAMHSSYKTITATGTQSATVTFDTGSTGGACGVIATFRAGENTDEPSGGGGGGGGGGGTALDDAFYLNLAKSDMDITLDHEYYMYSIPRDWGWGSHARYSLGANPPSDWPDAHFTPWGQASTTDTPTPQAANNWRVAIFALLNFEKRNGVWGNIGYQVTSDTQMYGAMYTDYPSNTSEAADERTSNGYLEVKLRTTDPTAYDGVYHWFPNDRFALASPTGAEQRATIVVASLTMDNPAGTDDRASAAVTVMAAGDFWRDGEIGWSPTQYNVDDYLIGRARKPAIYPNKSIHCSGTMSTDAEWTEWINYVKGTGILDQFFS